MHDVLSRIEPREEIERNPGTMRKRFDCVLTAAAAAFVCATSIASDAGAELGAVHPEVLSAHAAVRAARGPEVYGALRELWRTWDRADPAQVEAAIAAVAEGSATSAPARVYAELLSAYARRRRGDLDGAVAKIQKLGFIGRWATIGPFDNENKGGFDRAFGPEEELDQPIAAGRTYDGKARAVRWRVPPEAPQYGWFDFGDFVRPVEGVCGYATTLVRAKAGTRAPRPISLWVGADGAFKLFWNGEKVLGDPGYRELDIDRFAATVSLRPGYNRLTIKVCGGASAPKFALRIGNEKGAPDLDLDVTSDIIGTQGEAAGAKRAGEARAQVGGPGAGVKVAARAGAIEGPMQAFERAASAERPSPAVLEAFARYLVLTGGDAEGEHRARDLARRSAEAEPSVRRYVLAGQLSEDRNQQRAWIERAAALVGRGREDIDVLLAQARLAQTSPNWREAAPIYERILASDPDHVIAVLGLVDLYVEAGLKRTALATLERALSRQPNSVSLLRASASQLRALGRDTEAAEMEARYAALRFDDSSFLHQQVDLAVARRDPAGAERWLERFLRSEPDSVWARSVAARTYRALGHGDRALAAHQRALAMAPEDIGTLRALSDLYGEEGNREAQLEMLQQILAISPQVKDVREYIEHIEPPKPRADEAYAWAPDRFLPMRRGADRQYPKRTLRSLTVTTVFPNGLASRFRQVVFQPLTDEAAASARQYAFEYQADRQTVSLRAAKVYRADGKVDGAIESGEAGANNPALAMYTSGRTFYVSFPRLNAGDVVELRYRVDDVSPRNEIADHFGEIEYLQGDEPIASSEYVLITPKAKPFHIFASNLPGLVRETKEDADRRIYRFVAASVPPVAPEPAMPPWSEVLAHVHVSTFKGWDEVGSWYWGLAREQFDVDDEVRKRVREITKNLTDDLSKVRAIYKYATETRYVALEFGIEGIRPRRCAQTLARGWGDCKDKATLIVTMLRELGIPSTIVLVRTRMRGGIEPEPASLAPFDHAIAYVPSLDLYLDGTAEHSGSTELPIMDRGAMALQINEGKPKLVRLPEPSPEDSVIHRTVDIALGADGSAQLGVDTQVAGAFAPEWRTRYMAEGTRRDRAGRDLAADFGTVELAAGRAGVEVNDLEDIEQPVKLRARGKAVALARKEGDSLSIPAVPTQRLATDFASLSTRTRDVIIPALTTRREEWSIRVPQGWRVTRAPLPQDLDTPFGKFSISVEQSAGKVVVRSQIALTRSRIKPSEYVAFRTFCETADRAFGQRVVLGK
ncbi:DUF3857 domain-containing protein [Sorangium cellulosum]|uniref:Uncharacterized protein n=1 Tax=Sorangium cellulosum TaxID=56 RepID=A0A150QC24_SORCE|nr:DUF3857 domain-containing protein [Sorangium cellulosum]KYF65432.1 hypothetical protein BE15_09770 [Sorangium cellulosum]